MKQLNITFEDGEFKSIEKLKEMSNLDWRRFLILITEHCKESVKKGDLEFLK